MRLPAVAFSSMKRDSGGARLEFDEHEVSSSKKPCRIQPGPVSELHSRSL